MAEILNDVGELMTLASGTTPPPMREFVTSCLLARARLSEDDAQYALKFVVYLNELEAPFFSTLRCIDELFTCFGASASTGALPQIAWHELDEREATNIGIFLRQLLRQLRHWKSSDQIYESECAARTGFSVDFTEPDGSPRAAYEDFVKVMYKWHCRLLKGVMAILEGRPLGASEDPAWSPQLSTAAPAAYALLHALLCLDADLFPAMPHLSRHLEKRVGALVAQTSDPALRSLAQRYSAQLDAQRHLIVDRTTFMCGFG